MHTRRRFLRDSVTMVGAAAMWQRGIEAQRGPAAFDYIIVGAGSAGCVLANRLSADGVARVLLVEAGGAPSGPLIPEPGQWTSLIGSEFDWRYRTDAEPGLGGRRLDWPRGRVQGGSSAINAMAYVRGHRSCFDGWAEQAGAAWRYDAVLPIFRQLEDNSRGASDYLGAGGPLAVADTTDPHAGHEAFLEAAGVLGFTASPAFDFNGPTQENGAGYYQKNIRAGRRHSAFDAFVAPAAERTNLAAWANTHVHRVVFEGSRAAGIEASGDGRPLRASASQGVILAAGAIGSPHVLMLSGVGPSAALRALDLPVVADLPGVGQNLHDHPRVSVRWASRQTLPGSDVSAGLLTSSSGRGTSGPPDIQFYVGRGTSAPEDAITLTLGLSRMRSRGAVSLRSADPLEPPALRANYFTEPEDLEAMRRGVDLALDLAHTRAYTALLGAPLAPGVETPGPDEIRAFIRETAGTIFHLAGTCRMGHGPDAVVDSRLRVRGTDNLWVADASVMPTVVNAQTHAACLLIGDMAARFISNRG